MNRILFVSRPSIDKGLSVLLDALELTRSTDWSLTIVGEVVSSDRRLVQAARSRGMRIECFGAQNSPVVASIMRKSDILVVPSLYENFGNVALEGMASGCLVIASKAGGLVDLIVSGETGWLTEVGDPIDLSIALDITIAQKHWASAARKAAVEEAKNYSWEVIAKKTLDLIDTIHSK